MIAKQQCEPGHKLEEVVVGWLRIWSVLQIVTQINRAQENGPTD